MFALHSTILFATRVSVPRVAYLPDSFHEVNGVAHTSRNFFAYARQHDLPFLCIRAGTRPQALEENGNLRSLELSELRRTFNSILSSGDTRMQSAASL